MILGFSFKIKFIEFRKLPFTPENNNLREGFYVVQSPWGVSMSSRGRSDDKEEGNVYIPVKNGAPVKNLIGNKV